VEAATRCYPHSAATSLLDQRPASACVFIWVRRSPRVPFFSILYNLALLCDSRIQV
jgi:hypothetical protein